MSVDAAVLASPRSIRWSRRRASLLAVWKRLRRDRLAMLALFVLVGFIVLAVITPWISNRSDFAIINTGGNPKSSHPTGHFLLGTDNYGRSVALQVLWGARVSLYVGLTATVITVLIGTLVGVTAGFFGRWLDALLMRVTDWFLVIPFLPLAIVLASVLERGLLTIAFVIGITSWPSTARLVRSQVLSVRERLYVDRARSLGAGRLHIVRRHILPNVTPLIVASATLAVPISILTETTLSFLGLGDPTEVSWGGILSQARTASAVTKGEWWYYMPPGLAIMMVVLAFAIFGRALEEILDPRLRER